MRLSTNPPDNAGKYEISQKFCDNVGFSVIVQKNRENGEEKCLSSSLCGNKECDQSP